MRKKVNSRAPQGARGLKSIYANDLDSELLSRPARGAWVEMSHACCQHWLEFVAPRKGRVG